MNKYEIISFIPVRASNKMPRKNIEMIAGKPLLAWTIEASLKSNYVTRTFVSTEDREIKEVALQYGAEVIDRPAKYSKGESMLDWNWLLLDFKQSVWDLGCRPDYMIHLMVSTPLRTSKHIDEAFELMFSKNEHYVISVVIYEYELSVDDLAWICKIIDSNGMLKPACSRNLLPTDVRTYHMSDLNEIKEYLRKQGKGRLYKFNSVITAGEFFTSQDTIIGIDRIKVGYVMDKWDSIVIFNMDDFRVAEFLLKERIKKRKEQKICKNTKYLHLYQQEEVAREYQEKI